MAYPKINVNTGKSFEILGSDTIPIPSPYSVPLSGTCDNTRAQGLDDSTADFSNVEINDIVYNTTDNTLTVVTGLTSSTSLDILDDIFVNGEDYIIFQAGPQFEKRIESSAGCILYVGSNEATMDVAKSFVDVKVKTAAGSIVTFSNFPVGDYLPIQVLQLFSTGTDAAAVNNCLAIW